MKNKQPKKQTKAKKQMSSAMLAALRAVEWMGNAPTTERMQ